MKLTVLGCGSAFTTPDYWNSSYLLSNTSGNLLIDCGSDARHSVAEQGHSADDIDAVYVSHIHADHVGGLEWLGFSRKFKFGSTKLYTHKKNISFIKDSVNRSMCKAVAGTSFEDFFDLRTLNDDSELSWGDCNLSVVPNVHTDKPDPFMSYGLILDSLKESGSVYISTDTVNYNKDIADKVDLVIHDCETSEQSSTTHFRYEEALDLPKKLKSKTYLVHYNPKPSQKPAEDGFAGFTYKGMSFV